MNCAWLVGEIDPLGNKDSGCDSVVVWGAGERSPPFFS